MAEHSPRRARLLTSRCAGVHGRPIVMRTPTSRRRREGRAFLVDGNAAAIGSAPAPAAPPPGRERRPSIPESLTVGATGARYPSRHAPVQPVLHHAPRRPGRRRDAVPSPAASGRATCASSAPGIYSLLPLGFRVDQARRAGHPRGDERDRRPGDGDARRPPRRGVEGERPLRQDRAGAGPVQGPRRPGHGPGDDPRGGRRPPPARHRPELPPAARAALPLPDEVPRRAALARRPHPRPRVRHEGRLQLRPRRRRVST